MSREFEVRREITVAATPDEVFQAVATEAGNASWLFPTGPSPEDSTVWDPPAHFATRTEQGDWFNALEYTIEARDDGTTLIRYVHSGIFQDDWDNQFDAVAQHTDFYLATLAEYLGHFGGRTATYIGDVPQGIVGPPSSARPDSFAHLLQALGLDQGAGQGDRVQLTQPPVDGEIYYLASHFLGIRSPESLYCFFGRNAFGAPVAVAIHDFASGRDAEVTRRDWERWLNTTLTQVQG